MTANKVAAFFSYSRDDSSFVVRLAGDLKAAGANVWLDQMDIIPGQRWDRAIEDAMKNCPRLIVILSPTSVESTNVMDEVSFALEEHKTVIPVVYKDCEIPFRLRRLQYVDFKKDYAHGLKELLKVLAPQQAPEPSTPALPNVRDQIRPDIPEMKPTQTEAEQARLEDKYRKPADQARPEGGRMRTPAQDSGPGFFSEFPVGAKVGVAAFAILIVAFVLYWNFLPSRSNNQTEKTQKREPHVETTNPVSASPQSKEETQKQEPLQQKAKTQKRQAPVEATNPPLAEAEAALRPEDLYGKWQGTGTLQNGAPSSVKVTLAGPDPTNTNEDAIFLFTASFTGVGALGQLFFVGAFGIDPTSRTLEMGGRLLLSKDKDISFKCHLTAEDRRGRSFRGTCNAPSLGSVSLRLTR